MQVPQKYDLSDDSHLHENMYFICVNLEGKEERQMMSTHMGIRAR
jgi:hypothetical protein